VQLLYRTVLDFNVQIYRYLGPLKKVSVEISDLKRSKCLIKNVWYKFFEFESRKHISAARSVALIFAVTGFICRRGSARQCLDWFCRPRMHKSHSYQEYGPNMGRDGDVSMAKVPSRELRYHWYKYISLPLKRRLYSQILKSSRFCYWSAIFF